MFKACLYRVDVVHAKGWQTSKFLCAEASCKSQILTAQAMSQDIGEIAAAEVGLDRWARCQLNNSERDVQRVVEQQGSKLPVKVDIKQVGDLEIPWISPRTWLQFLVDKGLWPRLAGASNNQVAREMWSTYWANFQKIMPDFELFQLEGVDYSRTCAMLLHGDEGRSLKHQGIMVTALQSALGHGFDAKRLHGDGPQHVVPKVNYTGHSYLHRFVVSAMPKKIYEDDANVFHEAMEEVALSLKSLFELGVQDPSTKETFRVVLVGCKGDAPYLVKLGRFYRAYNTTAKRGRERAEPKGICHRCLAGTTNFPAEEIGSRQPKWLATKGVSLPWYTTPCVIQHLMHNTVDPASFFYPDIWHTVHLGFGRSWVASVLHLVLEVLPLPNLDGKWKRLSQEYNSFCRQQRLQKHVGSITPYLMSYGDATGTMGNWHKGALTTNFLKWLEQLLHVYNHDGRGLLVEALAATAALNRVFSSLYRADAFLNAEQCDAVSSDGLKFLRIYAKLANAEFARGKPWHFPLYPKLHTFHEIMLELRWNGQQAQMAFNPIGHACQMDEDVVGRASRISRRVNIRRVMSRTLDRYLIDAKTAFEKAGVLR